MISKTVGSSLIASSRFYSKEEGYPCRNSPRSNGDLKNTGCTMIVVTHEMEFARSVADTVIYMADGVIEEMGPPEQIFGEAKSEKTKAFLRGAQEKF